VSRFEDSVLTVLRSLEPGDVVTYGEIAAEAGFPGAARAVGSLLRKVEGVPWWRVVGSGGWLRSPSPDRQAALLAGEGVTVVDGRVVARGSLRE
jgi:methylated-DNA-protein-cysteine methyltransferase related protein